MQGKAEGPQIYISALAVLSALFISVGLSKAEDAQWVTQPAKITKVFGQVELMPQSAFAWRSARVAGKLSEGDKIRIGPGGWAELTLQDGSFIRLKQNTNLAIKTARGDVINKASQYHLDLRVGEIMLELKKRKRDSSFQIETPTAVAAVRGTTLYLRTGTKEVAGQQQAFTDLFLESDDVVDFTSSISGDSYRLYQGEASSAYASGAIEEPQVLPPAAQDAWKRGWEMEDKGTSESRGLRDVEEESADDEDDIGEDVGETTQVQSDSQQRAREDETSEQLISGQDLQDEVPDSDGDKVNDNDDLFPLDPNRASGNDADGDLIDDEFDDNDNDGPLGDLDGDGVNNEDDLFDDDPNRASGNDFDEDGIDNEFDDDDDNDGVADADDAFPLDPAESVDSDNDGTGNNADTDDDNDGYSDSDESDNETDPLDAESTPADNDNDFLSDLNDPNDDNDEADDIEDAFPFDDTVDDDFTFTNILNEEITVQGYGSRDELRQAGIDNLLAFGDDLRQDIQDLLADIQVRQFEAVKEQIFDHQAGKVMRDHWGNRVRVEEYVSNPTEDQVQVLALNLRTGGPNAGISSLDFRVKFDQDITNMNLKELPWDDYMANPLAEDIREIPEHSQTQVIIYVDNAGRYYNPQIQGIPIPEFFSLEVKNPYAESVKVTENYSAVKQHPGGRRPRIWYQLERETEVEIIGARGRSDFDDDDIGWEPVQNWGGDWNRADRFTFLQNFRGSGLRANPTPTWLMGVFYLIDDDGRPADVAEGEESLLDIQGIRDLINPDHNLEMVFFSSEFGDTDPNLPGIIADYMDNEELTDADRHDFLLDLYNQSRTVDAITIKEIDDPYNFKQVIAEEIEP